MSDGSLPEGWKWVTIEDICIVKGGKRLPKGATFSAEITQHPYIRVADMTQGTIIMLDLRYISQQIHQKISNYIISTEDIYISIAGTIGLSGVVPEALDGANLTENAARLIIKDKTRTYRDYMAFFLQSPYAQKEIEQRTRTVGQPKLALTRIKTIPVPLPPIEEQERIAAIIAEQMAEVEEMRQAALDELAAAEALSASYLREVFESEEAQGWEWTIIGKLGTLISGGTPDRNNYKYFGGETPWVKTGDLNYSIVCKTEENITSLGLDSIRGKLLPIGTVMIAMYGGSGTIGKSAILGIEAVTNQSICGILPNQKLFIPEFLHAWIRYMRSEWMQYSSGNRRDPNINKSIIYNMRCPLPPVYVQKNIVENLSGKYFELQKIINGMSIYIAAIEALPASILRRAFNGEY